MTNAVMTSERALKNPRESITLTLARENFSFGQVIYSRIDVISGELLDCYLFCCWFVFSFFFFVGTERGVGGGIFRGVRLEILRGLVRKFFLGLREKMYFYWGYENFGFVRKVHAKFISGL